MNSRERASVESSFIIEKFGEEKDKRKKVENFGFLMGEIHEKIHHQQ
jgi:hypothetical protein